MSNKYKHGDTVPSAILCSRLDELSKAVTKGKDAVAREFTMRVPAEMDRDADLVLAAASRRIGQLEAAICVHMREETLLSGFEVTESDQQAVSIFIHTAAELEPDLLQQQTEGEG